VFNLVSKILEETNVVVEEMQLESELKKKSDKTSELMKTLATDQEKVDDAYIYIYKNFKKNIKIKNFISLKNICLLFFSILVS
jgi:hypothetical protein